MRNRPGKRCRCRRPNCCCPNEIIYPVTENVVHCCTEEVVKHIHPSHTTIMNHHLVKNEHLFPHTTSVENTYNEIDVNSAGTSPFGGNSPNQVAGAFDGNFPGMGPMSGGGGFNQQMNSNCQMQHMNPCGKCKKRR